MLSVESKGGEREARERSRVRAVERDDFRLRFFHIYLQRNSKVSFLECNVQ